MIDNGIKPGAYHYYVPSDDAAAQAKHFASVIKASAGSYSSNYVIFIYIYKIYRFPLL